jgi:hypothetical protein
VKRFLLWIALLTNAFHASAQTNGNEWIDYSRRYYKFPVQRNAVYRIDSITLASAFNLAAADARNFKVFLMGKELRTFVQGEADNRINTSDYIEFYAEPSAGSLDSLLYHNIKYLPNPYVPIYNDTVYAFVTLASSPSAMRMQQVTDTLPGGLTPSDYFYTEAVYAPVNSYNEVQEFDELVSDSRLTQAEGKGLAIQKGGGAIAGFANLNVYNVLSNSVVLTACYSGQSRVVTSAADHQVKISFTDKNNAVVVLSDTLFSGYLPVKRNYELNAQDIGNACPVLFQNVAAPSFSNFSNYTMLHYLKLVYPHSTTMGGAGSQLMFIDDDVALKRYFQLTGFASGAPGTILYDLTNGRRILTFNTGGQLGVIVPNGQGRKKCVLRSESSVIKVLTLTACGSNGLFQDPSLNLAVNSFVIIHPAELKTSSQSYATYRNSAAGGGYPTLLANVNDLYEQFGYGCNKHPVAIRNFLGMLKRTQITPAYVLLIGHGTDIWQLSTATWKSCLLPSIGAPSADHMYTSSLTNNNWLRPEISIGRIAAAKDEEVIMYLDKVKEHEMVPHAEWKKNVLHFPGGDEPILHQRISDYMLEFERTIADTLTGAGVLTFNKNTSSPVQTNISDSIRNCINRGAAIINVFGHGALQTLDQAVDDVNMYSNKGRYPFFIANSCYSGDIHSASGVSVSERLLLQVSRGTIGFLASSGYSYDNSLYKYTQGWYTAAATTHYGAGAGDIVREAANKAAQSSDVLVQYTSLAMTLHGDPAVKIFTAKQPDYEVRNSDVTFDTKRYPDSLGLYLSYRNTGKAVRDSILIRVERFFPSGDSTVILKQVKAPMYRDSLKIFLHIDFDRGYGLNEFNIKLDDSNKISESNEGNNSLNRLSLFIPGADIAPVYPYKFAVIPLTATVVLKACTTDPFAPQSRYVFQIDTSGSFNNPLQAYTVTSTGGVVEWKVNIAMRDSAVYFWRVSRDSVSPQKTFAWRESSFQMIGSQRGWGQAAFYQHKGNEAVNISRNFPARTYSYLRSSNSIVVRNGIHPYLHHSLINFYYNNKLSDGWSSAFDGWNFALFDSISGEPVQIKSNNYPNTGPGPFNTCVEYGVRNVYSFGPVKNGGCITASDWRADMETFLKSVPAGQYILGYTTGYSAANRYADIYSYSQSLYNELEKAGAKRIRLTTDSVAYSFFSKKGSAVSHEEIGKNRNAITFLADSISSRWTSGSITSEKIGPSDKWRRLKWRITKEDASDTSYIMVTAYKKDGKADTIVVLPRDSSDVNLENYVNASVYPFIRLTALLRDTKKGTVAQLRSWHVLYDEAPECAINPLKGFSLIDTLQEGDEVVFRVPIENIGHVPFTDSLAISYWLEDQNKQRIDLPIHLNAPPFQPGGLIVDTLRVSSYKLRGNNTMWVHVNPVTHPKYQNEQYQFNNLASRTVKVTGDVANPLLDVTFDGVRILNGDIVSARPEIMISLKDENRFLALNDTSAFTVKLEGPSSALHRVYFGSGLDFVPGALPDNSAKIFYRPVLRDDGMYRLVIQATDRSNNKSAASEYMITFEVSNKPTVTNVVNYPNPFSTSTKFVFTLTGSEVPDVFTLQIMTISGKIVKEITRNELGYLHIGRNITDYAWDGRDQYGDRLANGVYLYRVITKLNGAAVERRETVVDKYFVQDFGKMVLMR